MILLDKNYALEKAENQYYLGIIDEQTKNTIINFINNLSSVQSVHPKGYWIKKISKEEKNKKYTGYTPYWYCSKCGKKYEPALANTIINYCYNCGADMRGEEDG